MNSIVKSSLVAATALLACGFSTSANASDVCRLTSVADGGHAVTVRYGDLNLNSKAGAEAMVRRIESAANMVCRMPNTLSDLRANMVARACVRETIDRTMVAIDMPMVAQILSKRASA